MFLINSRRSRFTVTPRSVNPRGHPLSRSYGVILQSSLTTVLPSALDYSSRLPVSVLVRSPVLQPLGAFLGRPSDDFANVNAFESRLLAYEGGFAYPSPQRRSTDISTRTAHLSNAVPPSVHSSWRRNVDLLSIVYAFRPRLRYRLTLGGITFPRKP